MNVAQKHLTAQQLRQYVIVAGNNDAAMKLAEELESHFKLMLPVIPADGAYTQPCIFAGTREFQNYGGYRCCVELKDGNLYLDGGTEELFSHACQMMICDLQNDGIAPRKRYGYCWRGNELQYGLQIVAEEAKTLCDGVTYMHRSYKRGSGEPVETYIVIVSKDSPAKAAVWGSPQGQSQVVPAHVEQMRSLGKDVIAAVNADFFHFFNGGDKTTFGIQVIDGVVYKEPSDVERYGDHWFGLTNDDEYVMSDLDGYREKYHGKLLQAVGGGVWLMQEQRVCVPGSPAVEPRTAVATTMDGGFVMLCVDGRSLATVGATYADLLQVFLDLPVEIRTVLNLDGGHSTILMCKQENGEMAIFNNPSSGLQDLRPIADILALVLPKQE